MKTTRHRQRIQIGILYILMGAGGLWHLLHRFQDTMRILASPMIAGVAVWVCWQHGRTQSPRLRPRFIAWALLVFAVGIGVEVLGVQTGWIFGAYIYGDLLKPFIARVPVAMGFAWLGMLLCSAAVAQRVPETKVTRSALGQVLLIALLMLLFDLLMESAAVKLGYWRWLDGTIPFRNYLAWFLISLVFAYLGVRMGIFREKVPSFVAHAYVAQLMYFGLAGLS